MSEAPSPLALQRRALEQGRRVARQQFDVQRRLTTAFRRSMDAQRDAQREASTVVETALELPVVAARGWEPENRPATEFENAYREGVSSLDSLLDESWTRTARNAADGVETYEAFAGFYADLVDAGFAAALDVTDELAAAGDPGASRRPPRERPVEVPVAEGDGS